MNDTMQRLRIAAIQQMIDDMKVLEEPESTEPPCPQCNDLGMVSLGKPVGDPDFGKLVRCPNPDCRVANANRTRARDNRVRTAKIPLMFQRFTFQSWDINLTEEEKYLKWQAYYACRFFVTEPGHYVKMAAINQYLHRESIEDDHEPRNWIMLQGPLGVGKTGLAIAAVNALIEDGQVAMYIRARDMLREVQGRYGRNEERITSDDMIEEFATAPILLIDEFNVRNEKSDRLEIVETIIRLRYGNLLPTLMTANLDREAFSAHWGDFTADVILHASHWIYVGGAKLRKTPRTAREG